MSNSKNGSQPNGITNEPLPASHKILCSEPAPAGCAGGDARDQFIEWT